MELFNLADVQDEQESDVVNNGTTEIPVSTETLSALEKIERALPLVRGLESSDVEMDELAELAVNSYKDFQDLGLQVDSRYSSEILAVASTMLGHAITAKMAKTNKKIKMLELQLKQATLQQRASEKIEQIDAIPLGEGKLYDRNELLRMMSSRTTKTNENGELSTE